MYHIYIFTIETAMQQIFDKVMEALKLSIRTLINWWQSNLKKKVIAIFATPLS